MSKFNGAGVKTATKGFTGTIGQEIINHQGGTGFLRDEKSDLFLSTVSSFLEDTFYESGQERESRISKLASKVAVNDPLWITNFVEWLRGEGNIRSAAIVVALESANAMIKAGIPGSRVVVSSALQRADEPGEAIAYWHSRMGRKIPSAVKRGISDAIVRLYNEYSVAKYNSAKATVSLKDAISLTHPKPKDDLQSFVFKYINDRSYDSSVDVPSELTQLKKRQEVMSLPNDELKSLLESSEGQEVLKSAGLTWESVAGKVGLSKGIWSSLIPSMGYMALLRNLRNFQESGVDTTDVLKRISDPDQVAKSRQFPFRFFTAASQVGDNLKTAYALEEALNASLVNVPELKGKTLIMVDRSGSMHWASDKQGTSWADKAAVFGSALALRAEDADLYGYGTSSSKISYRKSDSIIPTVKKFRDMGGTNTTRILQDLTSTVKYDRVIIITDEQSSAGNPSSSLNKETPLYIWNVVGYGVGHNTDVNRYTFGGLTDHSFRMIPLLESGKNGTWPWGE